MLSVKIDVSSLILLLFLLIVPIYLLMITDYSNYSVFVLVGFIFNGLISIYGILSDKHILSMNKFFWYFQYIFMFLAPLCNYITQYFPWGYFIGDDDIMYSIFIVLLWNITYLMFYKKMKININMIRLKKYLLKPQKISLLSQVIIFSIAVISFISLVELVGFENMFYRSTNEVNIEDSVISFIVSRFLRSVIVIIAMAFIALNMNKKLVLRNLVIGIVCTFSLIVNFPASVSRYWMGALLGGLLFFWYCEHVNSRKIDYLIIINMVILFPLLSYFKFHNISDLLVEKEIYSGMIAGFNTIDFDAFTLISRTVDYVNIHGLSFGEQLLNVIFFFVPRSIWVDKPLVTSIMVVSSQNQEFTNLSCPLAAEGYINFGLIGVVLFSMVYAVINRYIDDVYWDNSNGRYLNIINILYPILCLNTLTINRGPLQPSFVPTVAIIMSVCFVSLFFKRRKVEGDPIYE